MPPLASLSKVLYTFSVSCFSKSKECLKVVKVLPDPCPEFTFQDERISQKILKKEKPVLEQETLLFYYLQFSAVAQSCLTLCDPMKCSMPGLLSITNSQSSLKLMSIELVMPSSRLILCCPLLLLPPIPPSIRVFSNESSLRMRWPKYWSFTFRIVPSKEHPGLISFRMDWLELLVVPGTLQSLLQHHSSKASILRRSAFFTVQLSHPYMTTGKTIKLTLLLLLLLLSCFSHVRLCVTPEMAAHQAASSLGFSRQEHWSGLPFPSPTTNPRGYQIVRTHRQASVGIQDPASLNHQ